ncbi:MAG: serine hydrolase [Alphaproteobacteria bacterium]|nr:serine hydrolase [Alphaproteobacteria bacterium]
MDAQTGRVIKAENADASRYPASLTKMMTLYILFERLQSGRLTLDQELKVTKNAASQAPSKLGLRAGDTITVEQAIKALVIRSANDVAVVIAEGIGGSESRFARIMTQKARALGMKNSHFFNASGLPHPYQRTTARDMATLGRALMRDFPQYYPYFKLTSFRHRGVTYETHNDLLVDFNGTNGIKTGYTRASGFNLVSSVERGGKRVIGVVMGGVTARERDWEMRMMLDDVFADIKASKIVVASYAAPAGRGGAPVAVASAEDVIEAAPAPVAKPIRQGSVVTMAPIADEEPAAIEPERIVVASLPPEAMPEELPEPQMSPQRVAALRTRIDPGQRPALVASAENPKLIRVSDLQQRPVEAGIVPTLNGFEEGDSGEAAATAAAPRIVPVAAPGQRQWGIQVGAYRDQLVATEQVKTIARNASTVLGDAEAVVTPYKSRDGTLYRARFGPFTPEAARKACEALESKGLACLAVADSDWAQNAEQ